MKNSDEMFVIEKPWKKDFYHTDDILPKKDSITIKISYEYRPDEAYEIDRHAVFVEIESGVNFVVLRNAETKEKAMEIMYEIVEYISNNEYLNEHQFFRHINTEDALAFRN